MGSPNFRYDLCERELALDPGRTTMPRKTAWPMLRSTVETVSAPSDKDIFVAQSQTPFTRSERFAFDVTVASRNTRFWAAC